MNFEPILTKMRGKLGLWSTRGLSLLGKVTVLKSQGLTYLQYAAAIIPLSDRYGAEFTRALFRFLWGKVDKISRDLASRTFQEGGLQLRLPKDIAIASQAHWLRRWARAKEEERELELWQKVLDRELQALGGNQVLAGKIHKNALVKIVDTQTHNIISAWNSINRNPSRQEEGIPSICVWNNTEVTTKERNPIFCKSLFKAGISTVGQIFDNNGDIIKFAQARALGLVPMQVLDWMTLTKSIPHRWFEYMREH